MIKNNKRLACVLVALLMSVSLFACSDVALEDSLEDRIEKTCEFAVETITDPISAPTGGEWLIIALVKAGMDTTDEYVQIYKDNLSAKVKSSKGILNEEFYTEYARVSLALCEIGEDPTDFMGYDLVRPLDDIKMIKEQGVNAAIYALIASNRAGVKLENEENYLDYIMGEATDGVFYPGTGTSVDYTAMALHALSYYQDREEVKALIEKQIVALSKLQTINGSYGTSEGTSEAIIALCSVGIDPFTDERFIKDGNSLGESLLIYAHEDGFKHIVKEEQINQMSTEDVLMAMNAMKLQREGKKLY